MSKRLAANNHPELWLVSTYASPTPVAARTPRAVRWVGRMAGGIRAARDRSTGGGVRRRAGGRVTGGRKTRWSTREARTVPAVAITAVVQMPSLAPAHTMAGSWGTTASATLEMKAYAKSARATDGSAVDIVGSAC